MDFSTLLQVAKKNNINKQNEGCYYKTKFAPPKKETKKEKELSQNIQKFLKKRELEEREKQQEEKRKLSNLLSMRDDRAKNKIRKMLKVTKSANKSVLDDAINTEHTAVTMNGPEQPDQDDYGYVSMEANAFYQKYIEKVKDVKEDKGFAPSRPVSIKDLSGTKERVKAAITREVEEKKGPRQRSSHSAASTSGGSSKDTSNVNTARAYSTSKTLYNPDAERAEEERKKREEQQRKIKNRKPAPPPMDFQALLKLAEKKQFEPIEIAAVSSKPKEPERLLTSKEKRELEERQRAKEQRDRRERERESTATAAKEQRSKSSDKRNETATRMEPNGRIPKLSQAGKPSATTVSASKSSNGSQKSMPINHKSASIAVNSSGRSNSMPSASKHNMSSATAAQSSNKKNELKKPSIVAATAVPAKQKVDAKAASVSKNHAAASRASITKSNSASSKTSIGNSNKSAAYSGPTRQFPPPDVQQKTRQFPPADVRRSTNDKKPAPIVAHKRRIEDDDDYDEDYDSEMDDFIDDGDEEEDISAHIRNIFGYDRSKYRNMNDDDDAAMESNFAQVQREEFISKKIGLKEDLEDMKMEAMHKKRKMEMKKRRLH